MIVPDALMNFHTSSAFLNNFDNIVSTCRNWYNIRGYKSSYFEVLSLRLTPEVTLTRRAITRHSTDRF